MCIRLLLMQLFCILSRLSITVFSIFSLWATFFYSCEKEYTYRLLMFAYVANQLINEIIHLKNYCNCAFQTKENKCYRDIYVYLL